MFIFQGFMIRAQGLLKVVLDESAFRFYTCCLVCAFAKTQDISIHIYTHVLLRTVDGSKTRTHEASTLVRERASTTGVYLVLSA